MTERTPECRCGIVLARGLLWGFLVGGSGTLTGTLLAALWGIDSLEGLLVGLCLMLGGLVGFALVDD